MSTSSTGLTGTTTSTGSTLFNGTSRFSTDFQNVITREVAIASLPMQQLQSEVSTLQSEASAITTIQGGFTSLQSSLQQLQSAVASGSLAASSSDNTIAQATLGTGAQAGTYTINVSSLGSYTNTLSQAGSPAVTDPSTQNISSSGSYTLTINGTQTTITPTTNSLDGLVSAINSTAGSSVQASIVNLGSSSSPDYRLSLQSNELGPDDIQLNDGSNDLLSAISTGSLAVYEVDGVQNPISSTSRTITLAPGLTVNLTGQSADSTSQTTIAVSSNTSGIQSALSSFVNAFNSIVDSLNQNVGQSGGALQGNNLVYQLTNALQSLGNYSSGSGDLNSLASIGITFDKTGHLSLDASAFSSAASNQLQNLTNFLGDTSSGGFLQFAQNQLTGVLDSTTGLIPGAASSLQSQISNDNALISTDQTRVNALQTNLQAQLSASDALVASLEQNYNLISGLFTAEQTNLKAQNG
jgi:flagellar hook-associated protein 2